MAAFGEEAWRAHAELVGEVTLGWNQTVFKLLQIFSHLTGLGSPLADAIFFSHQSDRAQRGLVARVAAAVDLAELDQKTLKALLNRLDKIATHRNLATHTIFSLSASDPDTGAWRATVVPAVRPAQDPRLDKDFTGQFRRLEENLVRINRDLESWIVHTPLPRREWGMPTFVGDIPGYKPIPSGPQLSELGLDEDGGDPFAGPNG